MVGITKGELNAFLRDMKRMLKKSHSDIHTELEQNKKEIKKLRKEVEVVRAKMKVYDKLMMDALTGK